MDRLEHYLVYSRISINLNSFHKERKIMINAFKWTEEKKHHIQ